MATGDYINQTVLGQAYPCCTRGVGHLSSIWSFRNPNTPHRGANRYYSANGTPRGPQWTSSGEAGQVLAQNPGTALPCTG